jgi:hypothetical protein
VLKELKSESLVALVADGKTVRVVAGGMERADILGECE